MLIGFQLSEQKNNLVLIWFVNFYEVWRNDEMALFQNSVRFFASPDI